MSIVADVKPSVLGLIAAAGPCGISRGSHGWTLDGGGAIVTISPRAVGVARRGAHVRGAGLAVAQVREVGD